jgi:seryl-tRNA synthetase
VQNAQTYAEGQAQDTQAYAEGYYPETYYQQAMDVETVREVSRQVVEEELSKIKAELVGITKLKTELSFQVQNIDNRLVRIESTMQELQTAILKRIGSYGEAITDISKELRATQDSFSKMVNPIMNLKQGKIPAQSQSEYPQSVQQQTQKQKSQSQKQQTQQPARNSESSNKPSFEDYFR